MGREEDNRTLAALDDLIAVVNDPAWQSRIKRLVVRNRFTPGQKLRRRGEMGVMEGIPGPHYSDSTGDDAVWSEEIEDPTGKAIAGMARTVRNLDALAANIFELSTIDPEKRARRSVPDCLACGQPCHGGVRSGFCDRCRKEWDRLHRPDRGEFMARVRREMAAREQETADPPPPDTTD